MKPLYKEHSMSQTRVRILVASIMAALALSVALAVPEPGVSLSVRKGTAEEPGTLPSHDGAFVIRRGGSTALPLTVRVRWGGTATGGQDYEATSESYTIKSGYQGVTVSVGVKDDPAAEGDETVTLEILPGGYWIDAGGPLTVTIRDNDQ
jgi:mannan endo-1,4-beta-mannosidase